MDELDKLMGTSSSETMDPLDTLLHGTIDTSPLDQLDKMVPAQAPAKPLAPVAAEVQQKPTVAPSIPSTTSGSWLDTITKITPFGETLVSIAKSGYDLGQAIGSPDTPEQTAMRKKISDAGQLPDNSSIGQDLQKGFRQNAAGDFGNELAGLQFHLEEAKRGVSPFSGYSQKDVPALEGKIKDVYRRIVEHQTLPPIPDNPVYSEVNNLPAGDFTTSVKAQIEALKTSPWGYLRSSAAQNLPSSIAPIVGGVVGSIAGPGGAAAGAGIGSYGVEHGSDIYQGLQDFGANLKDTASIEKVWNEHGPEIMRQSRNKAAVVAFFDAVGGGVAGKIAELPARGVIQRAAQVLGGSVVDATGGMAGEGVGQIASKGHVEDWNSVFQEAMGGIVPGAVQEGGQIVAQGVRSGIGLKRRAMPSEEELKLLWNESQPKTPEGIPIDGVSTYREAISQGRNLFGYGDGSGAPVVLGSYTEAEAKAGLHGLGQGKKIIAVTSEQAQEQSAGDSSLQGIPQPVLDSPGMAVFSGPTQGLGITPREDNLLPTSGLVGTTHVTGERTYNDGLLSNGRPGVQTHAIDLDTLQADTKAQSITIVPAPPMTRLMSVPELAGQVDNTFSFASPEAKAIFLAGDKTMMASLFASGQVAWKGRIDPRFLTSGTAQISDSGRGFQFIDNQGKQVSSAIANKIIQNSITAAPNVHQALTSLRHRAPTISETLSDPLSMEMELFSQDTPVDVVTFGNSPIATQLGAWVTKLHELVGLKMKIIFVSMEQGVPDELTNQYPKLAGYLKRKDIGDSRGRFIAIHPDVAVITLHHTIGDDLAAFSATVAHEFGHVVMASKLISSPLSTIIKMFGLYRREMSAYAEAKKVGDTKTMQGLLRNPTKQNVSTDSSVNSYFTTFEEWAAELTSRWALTQARPAGELEKFFASGSAAVKRVLDSIPSLAKRTPEAEFLSWIESQASGETRAEYSVIAEQVAKDKGLKANTKFTAEPTEAHEASINVRNILDAFGPKSGMFASAEEKVAAKNAGVTRAVLDKYNWFYKWAGNLRQLSEANPHISELQLARELFAFAKNDATKIMVQADTILQMWRKLGEKRARNLSAFMFDLNEMNYLTDTERETGVQRWPTPEEFSALARSYSLDKDSIITYREVRDFFLETIKRQDELRVTDAMKITDPALQQAAIASAKTVSTLLASKPYFPNMRFGKFTVTVRIASNNKLEYFGMYETVREAKAAALQATKIYPNTDYSIVTSTVREENHAFIGMNPWILEKMQSMPGLTPDQLNFIEELRFMQAPSQSFSKHMMKRKSYKGYSTDGRRTFASYAFHHGRNYARVKYGDDFREVVKSLDQSLPPGSLPTDLVQRKRMADFLQHQINEFMNPSEDWAQLRAMNAIWHLGFNAKSAVVNMAQVLASAAFLGSKFGGVRAEQALLTASTKLSTFYRKGNYANTTDAEFRAIDRAMKAGKIDESQAAELAGLAVGGGMGSRLGKSLIGDKFLSGYIAFTEKAMWMFQMSEQWQRRVVFRAAWSLAMRNPNTVHVQEMQQKYFLQYQQLKNEGVSDREALAYLTAVDSLDATLGIYDKQSRPRYMQGRKSVLFAFQMFTQQNLWMLWNNKDMFARYMLYMGLMCGSMGIIPDDLKDLFNGMGRLLFGNGFDLERQVRKFIVELMGEDSQLPPDLILHGTARYGFGFPAIAQTLGAKFVPNVDLSSSITLNRLMPVDVTKLIAPKPGQKFNDILAQQTEQAAGAAYSVPIAMLKALSATDMEVTDMKRWEGMMPSGLRNVVKAARLMSKGADQNKMGADVMTFDGEDPEQLGEIMATALGFRPTRVSQKYDRTQAAREIELFWVMQKQMLMRQAYRDKYVHEDEDAFKNTMDQIRKYNTTVPDNKYAITKDGMKQSFRSRVQAEQKIESGNTEPPQMKSALDKMYPETLTRKIK